jgi:hypothetical protein
VDKFGNSIRSMDKRILLLAFLLILLTACSVEAPDGAAGTTPLEVTATARAANDSGAAPTMAIGDIPAPAVEIEAGRNDDGTFYLGSPDAPVTLIDYSDFL